VSLERNKIYAVLPDDEAERDGDLRVVDESGARPRPAPAEITRQWVSFSAT
jgi:hypothetical protein